MQLYEHHALNPLMQHFKQFISKAMLLLFIRMYTVLCGMRTLYLASVMSVDEHFEA